MLNVCPTILQKKSPWKSNIEKGGGEGSESKVNCDNFPTKLAKVVVLDPIFHFPVKGLNSRNFHKKDYVPI